MFFLFFIFSPELNFCFKGLMNDFDLLGKGKKKLWNLKKKVYWNWAWVGFGRIYSSVKMNSMKLVIPLNSWYWSIHTKDESKHGTAFAFIFDVNWLWHCGVTALYGVFFNEMEWQISWNVGIKAGVMDGEPAWSLLLHHHLKFACNVWERIGWNNQLWSSQLNQINKWFDISLQITFFRPT